MVKKLFSFGPLIHFNDGFNSLKFIWASSIGLEPGFKQHPSGPQALDLGSGSNKSNQNHECTLYRVGPSYRKDLNGLLHEGKRFPITWAQHTLQSHARGIDGSQYVSPLYTNSRGSRVHIRGVVGLPRVPVSEEDRDPRLLLPWLLG